MIGMHQWQAEVAKNEELNKRIRELELLLCRVSVSGPTSRLPTALLTDIKEALKKRWSRRDE